MKVIALFAFTVSFFCALGQEKDPLLKELKVYDKTRWTIQDSNIVIKITEESKRISYSESRRAELLARQAIQISGTIEYYTGQVDAYLALGGAKIYLNEKDSALFYVNKAEQLAKQKKLKRLEIRCIEQKGTVYAHLEQYDKATNAYLEAIQKGSKIGERETAKANANLGHVFKKLGNLKRSREYSNKAYYLGKKYKDTSITITALNILGLTDKSEQKFDEALLKYEEGLELARASKNLERQSQLLYNMSNIYFEKGNYDVGFELFFESIEISKVNGSYLSTAISFHSLSLTYFELGRIAKATQFSDSAMHYALLSENYEMIMEANAMKAEMAYSLGHMRDAFEYLSTAYLYKDSLNLSQLNDAAMTAENSYEKEKTRIQDSLFRVQKQLEIDNNNKINAQRLQSREKLLWIFAVVILLAIIGGYFLLKNNRLIKSQNALVLNQKEEIQQQHTEITDSINYAKRIQDAMIHKHHEWEKIGSDRYILFRPKDVVSGDFYWAYAKDDLAIWAVADCTGHGVPGAFMSMLGFSFLNEIIVEGNCVDPGEILNQLRAKIISALDEKSENRSRDGMDISVCVWNKRTNELNYAGANNPLWLIRHKSTAKPNHVKRITESPDSALELIEIVPDKMPVGFMDTEQQKFETKQIPLYSGDVLIQLTDGFADQFGGPNGKKLKYTALKRALIEHQSLHFSAQKSALAQLFDEWRGNQEQVDDVCLVGVKIP